MNIPEDRYIQVGTVNTRYWVAGEGHPVLLLHGFTNSVEDWLLNFNELAAHYRVYAVDLIGHGKTDKPLSASYHIDDLASFITRFMDAVDVKQADLIGHSLGGWICLWTAIQNPAYVKKIVLVDSAGLTKENPIEIRLMSIPGLGEFLSAMVLGADFEKYLAMQRKNWPDSETASDEMIRLKYEATKWEAIGKTALKTLRSIMNFFGTKDREYLPVLEGLPAIKNPMLVVWGRQDKLAPVANTQIIADRCPQAQIEIFDNCGHDAMVEKPGMFNQLVLEFLWD
jgi:pimeloyl-ACP methyl ester carboxylesterase